jgi:hypothetical protein
MMIIRGKQRTLRQNLAQCHFAEHESHIKSPGIEPRSPRRETSVRPFEFWHYQLKIAVV